MKTKNTTENIFPLNEILENKGLLVYHFKKWGFSSEEISKELQMTIKDVYYYTRQGKLKTQNEGGQK